MMCAKMSRVTWALRGQIGDALPDFLPQQHFQICRGQSGSRPSPRTSAERIRPEGYLFVQKHNNVLWNEIYFKIEINTIISNRHYTIWNLLLEFILKHWCKLLIHNRKFNNFHFSVNVIIWRKSNVHIFESKPRLSSASSTTIRSNTTTTSSSTATTKNQHQLQQVFFVLFFEIFFWCDLPHLSVFIIFVSFSAIKWSIISI